MLRDAIIPVDAVRRSDSVTNNKYALLFGLFILFTSTCENMHCESLENDRNISYKLKCEELSIVLMNRYFVPFKRMVSRKAKVHNIIISVSLSSRNLLQNSENRQLLKQV